MKRAIIVLAVLSMAVTSYTQTSRRSASTNSSARTRENTRVAHTNNNTRQTTNREQAENRSAKSTSTDNRTARSNRSGNNTTYNRHSNSQRTVHVNNNSGTTNQRTTTRTTTTTVNTPVRKTTHVNSNHGHGTYRHDHSTTRVYRGQHTYHYAHNYVPESREYRAKHYVYREPVHVHIVWTRDLHRHYIRMYPSIRHWEYRYGYRIDNVSAYYADYYIGDVKTVYGRVKEVFYARESDEFFLYVGDYYPYQDFTIVLPGSIARKFSRRPEAYFTNEYVDVTGLITQYEGKPEIVVKRNFQLSVY